MGGGGGGLISGGWGISGSLRYFIFHPQLKYMFHIYSLTEITLKSIIISSNVLFYFLLIMATV